ncbi:MAG: U32 family peptidase [Bacilli bacterium]
MKLIAELQSLDNLNDYQDIDYLLIPTSFSLASSHAPLTSPEIAKVMQWTTINKTKAVIKVDQLIENKYLNSFFRYLDKYAYYDCLFLYSDFAVFNYFDNKGMLNKLMYNAPTLVCNTKDCEFYNKRGIKVILSNELSIEEITECAKEKNVIVQSYGYFPIYYSQREILSLYNKNVSGDTDYKNKLYYLKEEKREEMYPVFEKENYTVIFSKAKILIYKDLEKIKPEYIFINSNFLKPDNFKMILNLYVDGIKNGFKNDDKIKMIDDNYESSLLYSKSNIL